MSVFYPKIDTLFERDPETFKVDPSRFKKEVYSIIKAWEFTEKIDGTNILIDYSPEEVDYYIRGRTKDAIIPQGVIDYIRCKVRNDDLSVLFGDKSVIIYGEGYGWKIQNGGEYVGGRKEQKFIVFDVKIGHYWLSRRAVEEVAKTLELSSVPFMAEMPIEHAVQVVRTGFISALGNKLAEGLVGRPRIPLLESNGSRLILKLKTCDF